MHRLGVGRIRHLSARALWLQQKVQKGAVLVERVADTENFADGGTKPLSGKAREEFRRRLGVRAGPAMTTRAAVGAITTKMVAAGRTAIGLTSALAFGSFGGAESSSAGDSSMVCAAGPPGDDGGPVMICAASARGGGDGFGISLLLAVFLLALGAVAGQIVRKIGQAAVGAAGRGHSGETARATREVAVQGEVGEPREVGTQADALRQTHRIGTQTEEHRRPHGQVSVGTQVGGQLGAPRDVRGSMLFCTQLGVCWHMNSGCYGLRNATHGVRELRPCQLCGGR